MLFLEKKNSINTFNKKNINSFVYRHVVQLEVLRQVR